VRPAAGGQATRRGLMQDSELVADLPSLPSLEG
jgi:hypothetical protein